VFSNETNNFFLRLAMKQINFKCVWCCGNGEWVGAWRRRTWNWERL